MSKVLVAEDEPGLLEFLCELVNGLGHECLRAENGKQAFELARKHQPDMVVTDYMMPVQTGIELIRALRGQLELAHLPVLLLSAGKPPSEEQKEAWRFLSKPVGIETFESAVSEGLAVAAQSRPGRGFQAKPPKEVSPLALTREAMLSWVAHEIKSPLSTALMASQLAIRDLQHGEPMPGLHKRLTVIARQLVRMDELVSSILDAARLHEENLELDLETIDLAAWVKQIVDYWRELQPEHSFFVEDGADIIVKADRERLRQILDNLISNAIKYGGSSKSVRIDIAASEQAVTVSVTDEGEGIAPDELPHIFNRFHRVPGQGGRGHGLGLYIAAALARLHGGELTVHSERGVGSTFTLHLPRSEETRRLQFQKPSQNPTF